ncbi:MAG: hypothetical protein ABI611_19800 [Solirubrobacteraceae bacterium]
MDEVKQLVGFADARFGVGRGGAGVLQRAARPRPSRVSANWRSEPLPRQVSQPPRRRSSRSSRTLVSAGFHSSPAATASLVSAAWL